MRVRPAVTVAVIAVLAGGCGTEPVGEWAPATRPSSPAAAPMISLGPAATVFAVPSATSAKPSRAARLSSDWEITVYYTAVERFHSGDDTDVTGCPDLNCKNGDDDLGTYPADFVEAVQSEGTGRTESGKYLNWSYDVGYWLDSVPRASDGEALIPWVSAAADPDVLPQGTTFTVARCGSQDDGSAPTPAVCASLRRARWQITDEFTPGLGGPKHIDAYIGPETGPGFTDSDWYITLTGARLTLE